MPASKAPRSRRNPFQRHPRAIPRANLKEFPARFCNQYGALGSRRQLPDSSREPGGGDPPIERALREEGRGDSV